jgi:hypothetical protein
MGRGRLTPVQYIAGRFRQQIHSVSLARCLAEGHAEITGFLDKPVVVPGSNNPCARRSGCYRETEQRLLRAGKVRKRSK